jgi:hypothetical protein
MMQVLPPIVLFTSTVFISLILKEEDGLMKFPVMVALP